MSALRLWGHVRHAGIPSYMSRLQTVAHAEQAGNPSSGKEAAPVMLRSLLREISQYRSWLAAFLDTSHKLYPDRLAYKHELNPLKSRLCREPPLDWRRGLWPGVCRVTNKKTPELGNMIKLGTTRYGKSSAELCQHVDWEGSEIIFDIKGEIYPEVAGYLATRGRLLTIDLSRGLGNQYDPLQGIQANGNCTNWPNISFLIPMIKRRFLAIAPPKW